MRESRSLNISRAGCVNGLQVKFSMATASHHVWIECSGRGILVCFILVLQDLQGELSRLEEICQQEPRSVRM